MCQSLDEMRAALLHAIDLGHHLEQREAERKRQLQHIGQLEPECRALFDAMEAGKHALVRIAACADYAQRAAAGDTTEVAVLAGGDAGTGRSALVELPADGAAGVQALGGGASGDENAGGAASPPITITAERIQGSNWRHTLHGHGEDPIQIFRFRIEVLIRLMLLCLNLFVRVHKLISYSNTKLQCRHSS